MSLVVAVLRDVRERLTDPRHWLQGTAAGQRRADGRIVPSWATGFRSGDANCWCLSEAINLALDKLALNDRAWTELRSDVELELLTSLQELGWGRDNAGELFAAVYQWNDTRRVAHSDVIALLAETDRRLSPTSN